MAQALPPGLRGYVEMERHNSVLGQNNLSGLAKLQQLAEGQYKMGQEQAFRQEIAQARSPEEQIAIASKYMAPDALARTHQSHQDRQAALANTQQIAMSRLAQQAAQFQQTIAVARQNAKTREDHLRLDQAEAAFKQQVQAEASRLGGAQGQYNFGFVPNAPIQPTVQSPGVGGAAPAASTTPPAASSGLEAILAGRPPAEQQAIMTAATSRPTNLSVTPEGGLIPGRGDAAYQGPPPAVAQQPAAAPPFGPALPARPVVNLYRDEGSRTLVKGPEPDTFGNVLGGGGPVTGASPAAPVPTAAVTAPAGGSPGEPAAGVQPLVRQPQKPPEYSSWPKARRDSFDARMAISEFEAQTRADAARDKVEAKVNVQGSRESVQQNRVLTGANQAVAALQNIVKLPIESSTGILGTRGHSKGLMNAAAETLVQKMTTQDVQTYQILTTGIQRSLSAIESMGLAPPASLTAQMDGVIWKEGWTNLSKLYALAETRQIVEKAMDVIAANERVSPQQKELVQKILTDVRAAVPFTNADLIALQQNLQVNPNTTLADVVNIKSGGGGISTEERALIDKYKKK